MAVNSTSTMSIWLYDYLCLNIIGSEDYVRLLRMMNASKDQIYSYTITHITSGSFGEGLQLQGSDLDIMYVLRYEEVTEQSQLHDYHSAKRIYLLDTNDVKPGFAYLRQMKGNTNTCFLMCRSVEGQLYLSSVLFKHSFLTEIHPVVHGPCVSDKRGVFDMAHCLHGKSWIATASEWVIRSNYSWPTSEVKQRVIDHGVLFVPIGTGENLNEELKWRISFSVVEKFLIYSFTHTQLLCYALMKILLKDVISKSPGCKDLLCSYFIKTIIFWISEELPTSVWKPYDLIPCFMKCLKRLIYCVEYSVCPHYFIPENNLFENKIIGQGRTKLLDKLYTLINEGWRCIFFSKQISRLSLCPSVHFNHRNTDLQINIEKILKSRVHLTFRVIYALDYVQYSQFVLSNQSNKSKRIVLHTLSESYCYTAQTIDQRSSCGNKYQYKKYKQCLCYLLQSTQHNAVSGWLMLASFFYKNKQYNNALYILSYSRKKCSAEKPFLGMELTPLQRELFCLPIFRKLGLIHTLKAVLLINIMFIKRSRLIPDELQTDVDTCEYAISPVHYIHFLTFLCHYQLNNTERYQESLWDLQVIIAEDIYISAKGLTASSYNSLGVAFLIVGDKESAKRAFIRSINLFPDRSFNPSFKRLSMIDSL